MSRHMPSELIKVRPMVEKDLEVVLAVTNTAFAELIGKISGHKPQEKIFASNLATYRFHVDPLGCHVALSGEEVVGANFSVLRGTLAWFGPLAVRPDSQGHGIAQRLVTECVRSTRERGARLIGLETLANSAQHIHLYQKLGFRPSWTGIGYRREVRDDPMPTGIEIDGPTPRLDYVYPGYDASIDAQATRATKAGFTLTRGDGFAICHLTGTLWADTALVYVPLIAAADRATFDGLLGAIGSLARKHGKTQIAMQVPGSAWATQDALREHGYHAAGAALRMKHGHDSGYDAGPFFYCDDWH